MVVGYCVRCKKKQEMEDVKIVQTVRGGYMAKGTCQVCKSNMRAMISKENAEKAIENDEAEKGF